MALQTVNQFDIGTKFSNLGTGFAQGQQMGGQFQLGGERQAASERVGTEFEQEQSQLRASTINKLAINLSQLPLEQRAAALAQSGDILRSVNVDPTVFEGGDLSDATLGEVIAGTGGVQQDLGGRDIGIKSSAPITDPVTGQIGFPTFDPNTGKASLVPVAGAIGQTAEQQRQQEITQKKALSEVDISTTKRKETIKRKVARTSEITQQMSERNRGAARQQRLLTQALTLAQQASQGLTGTAKLQLSRLIPGIDSSDEGALDSTLKQLSLEMLSSFKGPTTDFEFGVTEAIGGALGQSKEANIARLKSLERARFFNEREAKQFQAFTKANGDPDNFRFDFSETVKTKKGPFTLEDIQATAVQNNLTIEETIKRLNK